MASAAAARRTSKVDVLKPYAGNARTHSAQQLKQLGKSIEDFGFTNPVLIDDQGIVAGHGRVLAVKALYAAGKTLHYPDMTPIPAGEVPTIDCTGWAPAKRRAYILADNKLAEISDWDETALQAELEALLDDDVDLLDLGFNAEELDALLTGGEEFEPNLAPESSHEPVTEAALLKGEAKLGEYFEGAAQQQLIDVMCPNCATEFHIDRPK
jgi:ParB-like chromosome segregation protein Spo0J